MGCNASVPLRDSRSRRKSVLRGDVNSLKAKDAMSLDLRRITMLMWESRNSPELVEEITEILVVHSNRRHLFDGVEFYLPQLAHMIIHLETKWPKDTLQVFALMVAQHSLHFALQLNWILVAAMEDYQPENENGDTNPTGDALLFGRCANLLHQLERAVVYSGASEGEEAELEAAYHAGNLTLSELNSKRIELRHKLAHEICAHEEETDDTIDLSGELLFKRWARNGAFSSKGWKNRMFRIQYKVLHCYRISDGALKRVIPLHHTEVVAKEHHTHKWYFEVREAKRDRVYKLVADSEKSRNAWIEAIRNASKSPPQYQPLNINKEGLSAAQLARYELFKQEREFVRNMTDICEELRFVEVPQRKALLQKRAAEIKLPKGVYLPLCSSTDNWINLTETVAEKCKAFSTRERCPCMMTFRATKEQVDVAHWLLNHESSSDDNLIESDGDKIADSAPLSPSGMRIASLWEEDDAGQDSQQQKDTIVDSGKEPPAAESTEIRVMAKSHDDLRQEVFIMQLIQYLEEIWNASNLELDVTPYRILSTSKDTGLIEAIENANSIHGWKSDYLEQVGRPVTLSEHFKRTNSSEEELSEAKLRFAKSLAGYSVATYILGIKDRHNGNIMLSNDGRIIHIDFGFVLGMAPGKDKVPHTNFSMERAAFKLTKEMSDVLGGVDSDLYHQFESWCVEGFLCARENSKTLLTLVEITAYKSNFPCFQQPGGGAARVHRELKQRLMLELNRNDAEAKFRKKMKKAHGHLGTMLYESFQKKSNGYEPLR